MTSGLWKADRRFAFSSALSALAWGQKDSNTEMGSLNKPTKQSSNRETEWVEGST